ncbi:potassium channel family protein [Rhodobacter capsulatus]|uniref:potassium channel family protein n=1 Tax=Rhodobacter capsulatus TaxID=1061 RepID=UPI0006DD1D29|nr:potassium channel family protein [Rhodobacter capsulatus]KQB12812.1 ion transporter [Rhodobacter capsulatus]KQB13140.1 ion transporter [Rhodobacter capsulatus]PZX28592.1 voltage-gated potassium channel [Rhodobacter capsulatus]QNR62868.1 potassium channel family protein [Rhodobacter capsulatus]
MLKELRNLYHGRSKRAHRFRYALLAFDMATILFVIVTSFLPMAPWILVADVAIGAVIVLDFVARVAVEERKAAFWRRLTTWADVVAMLSFLAPLLGAQLGFLRVLRTLRLLHAYQMLGRLRQDFRLFRKHEEVILAAVNLAVFLFVMTGLIHATQAGRNPQIGNYADALYFTVTTLTTTGFGDITLQGTSGRMISVLVMIVGVTLFLRLAQVLFRPLKVRHKCPSCGLMLHDADAVHCKHCGVVLNIKDEGLV